jgi:hypothetical protein
VNMYIENLNTGHLNTWTILKPDKMDFCSQISSFLQPFCLNHLNPVQISNASFFPKLDYFVKNLKKKTFLNKTVQSGFEMVAIL